MNIATSYELENILKFEVRLLGFTFIEGIKVP